MEFVQIEKKDTEVVFSIYKSCIAQHARLGFYQWDDSYPTLETVKSDIEKHQLFGLKVKGVLVAVIAITNDEPKEYQELKWRSPLPYVIIHRLCVSENHLRKGFAKKLMIASERYAKSKQNLSIRLDTFSLNKGAIQFYKNLDYTLIGKVNFSKRTDADYTCFEKIL